MRDHLLRSQTRIDQHAALHWAWTLLRLNSKKKSKKCIAEMLKTLSSGTDADFEALIKALNEEEEQ